MIEMYRVIALSGQIFVGQCQPNSGAKLFQKVTGFRVQAEHVGTSLHRKVELDLSSGAVTVVCNNNRFDLAFCEERAR